MRQFQSDTYSLHAEALLPLLLRTTEPSAADDRQALDVLRSWNYDAAGDSAAAAIFQAWFLKLVPVIAGDELGRTHPGGIRGPLFVRHALPHRNPDQK